MGLGSGVSSQKSPDSSPFIPVSFSGPVIHFPRIAEYHPRHQYRGEPLA